MSVPIAYQGEVMLAGWSETHNGGAKVTFWLQSSADLEPFKQMTVAKGKTAGQRLQIVAVELGDDEMPVDRSEEKPKGGALAKLAAQLCQNPEFWEFCGEYHGSSDDVCNPADAAGLVRFICNVESRADLDSNEEAGQSFHRQFRQPFIEWQQKRGAA